MRTGHLPGWLTINDQTAVKRFVDGLCQAGLPD
jgi:hypothetical protein